MNKENKKPDENIKKEEEQVVYTKEEIKKEKAKLKEAKLNKRGRKVLKCRPLKNFLWALVGFLVGFVILFGGIFAGVKLIPVKTYLDLATKDSEKTSEDILSEKISKNSIFDAIMNVAKDDCDYQIKDIPVLEDAIDSLINESGLGDYLEVNLDGIKEVYLHNGEDNALFDGLLNCITLKATALGDDLSKISVLTETSEVKDEVNTLDENFRPKLYYYLASGEAGTESAVYKRAFNDDKSFVNGVNANTKLYYPALEIVPLGDLLDIVVPTLDRVEVNELINVLDTSSDEESSNVLTDILEGYTIGDISSGEFDPINIKLSKVIKEDQDNELMTELLSSITGKDYGEIILDDLMNINQDNLNNVKLTTILEQTDNNKQLYDVLFSISGLEKEADGSKDYDKITIGLIANASNLEAIYLIDVLPREDYEGLYEILDDVYGVDENGELKTNYITLEELGDFDVSKVRLTSVLTEYEDESVIGTGDPVITREQYDANKKLWSVIRSAVIVEEGKEILLEDLEKEFSVKNVKIEDVLSLDNKVISILKGALNKVNPDGSIDNEYKLSLADLETLDSNNIRLQDVISDTSLLDIILNGVKTGEEGDPNKNLEIKDLTIGKFGDFKVENVKISNAIPDYFEDSNKALRDLIKDLYNEEDVSLSTLQNFNTDNIHLTTVIPFGDETTSGNNNKKLYEILCDYLNKDKEDIILSDIKEFDINSIKLETIIVRDDSNSQNKLLWDIIDKAVIPENPEIGITINDLTTSFDINGVELETILERSDNTSKLWSILDVSVEHEGNITVNDLINNFDINKITLKTLFDSEPDNNILKVLYNDDTVNVGNLAEKINDLNITDIFDIEVFTKEESKKSVIGTVYQKIGENYVKVEEGTPNNDNDLYYVSTSATVWLFVLFDYSEDTFTAKNVKVNNLDESINNVSDSVVGAKISLLIEAGILDETFNDSVLLDKTILDILNAAKIVG